MILNKGQPQQRPVIIEFPMCLFLNKAKKVRVFSVNHIPTKYMCRLFAECIRQRRLPQLKASILGSPLLWIELDHTRKSDMETLARRLKSNITACCLPDINLHFMRRHMRALNRMDLEQAAAVVLAAIRNDMGIPNRREIINTLVGELDPKVITQSCTWLEESQREPKGTQEGIKLFKVVNTLDRMLREQSDAILSSEDSGEGSVRDWGSLLPLLLRVRRCKPHQQRCLFIPRWIFDAAGMEPPPQYAAWGKYDVPLPGHEPELLVDYNEDNIILSRHHFRTLQRRLLRIHRFRDPKIRYRKAVNGFVVDVIHRARFLISKAFSSNNTIVVAHYFLALQRRLQRKAGSCMYRVGPFQENESRRHVQNNPDILTTFEQHLASFGRQKGLPVTEAVLPQIDRCCLLMKQYVKVYGGGRRENFVYTRGKSAKSSRGAEDQYNLLCKCLSTLSMAAKKEGLPYPAPVQKFLPIKTMVDNKTFGDDAFADGKIPGWEIWLTQREETGMLHRA